MLTLLLYSLASLAVLWCALSLFMYRRVTRMFKKYANMPRPEDPHQHAGIMRRDFGKWNKSDIVTGCFTRFPLHFGLFFGYIFFFASFAHLNKWIGLPTRGMIELYRKMFGRAIFKVMMKVEEDFDYREPIDTAFLVSNHVSENDIFYMQMCLPPVSFVSKMDHKQVFCIGTIAIFLKTLFVDRSSDSSKDKTQAAIAERVEMFKNDPQNVPPTVIYAEGTVSNGRSVLKFKNGAFTPMVPLTLMSLRYESPSLHMGHDELEMMEIILTTFCLKATLKVMKKRVEPQSGETVDEYRERCRRLIAEMGGFETYDYSTKQVWDYWYLTRDWVKQSLKQRSQ